MKRLTIKTLLLVIASAAAVAAAYHLLTRPPLLERVMVEYQQRLSRVLETPKPERPTKQYFPSIEWKQYLRPEPSIQISFLDSFELSACGLNDAVIKANSPLGKTTHGVTTLVQHLEIGNGLFYCLQQADLSSDVKALLEPASIAKTQAIPLYWNNYIAQEPTLRNLWLSATPPSTDTSESYQQLSATLSAHLALLEESTVEHREPDKARWLAHNKRLEQAPSIAGLIEELDLASEWLALNADIVADYHPFCADNAQAGKREILSNVLHNYYMAHVQPYLAELDHSALLLLEVLPHYYPDEWGLTAALGGARAHFHRATKAHVNAWQPILDGCQGL